MRSRTTAVDRLEPHARETHAFGPTEAGRIVAEIGVSLVVVLALAALVHFFLILVE